MLQFILQPIHRTKKPFNTKYVRYVQLVVEVKESLVKIIERMN